MGWAAPFLGDARSRLSLLMRGTLKNERHGDGPVDRELLARIRRDYSLSASLEQRYGLSVGSFWASYVRKETGPLAQAMTDFVDNDVALANVWDREQGLSDHPRGVTPGTLRVLMESMRIVEAIGGGSLMEQYPVGRVGRPRTFCFEGKVLTYRWARQLYFLQVFRQTLARCVPEDLVALDIGGGYGLWAGLLKREFPQSTQVICDIPTMLVLAHYYLANTFPGARCLTVSDVASEGELSRERLRAADFVLLPSFMADRLAPSSCELVTNFVSFGEMSREYFDYYFKTPVLRTNRFLFTVNRIRRDNGPVDERGAVRQVEWTITLLDYPLHDYETIYFGPCGFFRHFYTDPWYTRVMTRGLDYVLQLVLPRGPIRDAWYRLCAMLPARQLYHQPFFEFAGRRQDVTGV